MGKYQRKNKKHDKIGLERIIDLFENALKVFPNKDLSNKYVKNARKISLKYKIKIPKEKKRQFCSHCYSFLVPGENVRVRISNNKVIYYCLECKKYMRFPLK